jgi:hypothetical protein
MASNLVTQELQPHKVTKPIQLLAAWLLGLVLIDGAFLAAARVIVVPAWAPGILVVAAVLNVPLFLLCIFLLQTKFRPEMQEDSFYSRYLEVRQETGKLTDRVADAIEVKEMMTASHVRIVESLRALDASITHLRIEAQKLPPGNMEVVVNEVIAQSRAALSAASRQVQWSSYRVFANDLLRSYPKIEETLAKYSIPISDTFGSTSERPSPPKYPVITFGKHVEMHVIVEVCKILGDIESWRLCSSDDANNTNGIYIGAYGYGGQPVVRLDGALLAMLSDPNSNDGTLREWFAKKAERLLADPPMRPRFA